MKLIGITGKSGSGKTTLSDMIGKNPNVGVIHIDELYGTVKKEKLSRIMENDENGEPVTVKKSARKILYTNKYIFLIYMRIKGLILNGKINKRIEEFEQIGKDIVVIEGAHLKYFSVFKMMDKKVLVRRPYIERKQSVLLRDSEKNIDKEIFVLWDIPYKRSYYKENMYSYEYKIDNDSVEKLEQVAEEIYEDISQTNEQKRRKNNFKKYECEVRKQEKNEGQHRIEEREEKDIYEIR